MGLFRRRAGFVGVLGAITLAARSGLAAHLFTLSAVGAVFSAVGAFVFAGGSEVMFPTAMSIIAAAFFSWYAKRATS